MKNGHSKTCSCGRSPCLSHRYKGRYRCMECAGKRLRPTIKAALRAELVTQLLRLDGYSSECVGDMIRDNEYYYSCEVRDRHNVFNWPDGECVWFTRDDNTEYYIYRQKEPIKCDIFLFLYLNKMRHAYS